jgi:hypothetical protein
MNESTDPSFDQPVGTRWRDASSRCGPESRRFGTDALPVVAFIEPSLTRQFVL